MFHMKHKPTTKFGKWLETNNYSDPEFARALTRAEPTGNPFSYKSVYNWRHAVAAPRARALEAMRKATGGRVTAAMFVNPTEIA